MSRGRNKFKKIKPILNTSSKFISILPYPIRFFLLRSCRQLEGNMGLGIRYILLSTLTNECGDNVSIHPNVIILSPDKLRIGDNVSIHPFCYIDATGEIDIGNDVSIAHSSTIMSTEHCYADKSIPIKDQGIIRNKTVIQDNVWVGCGARILSGTLIQSGTIVAAGAVVKNILHANSIYGGIPAKRIKDR